MAINETLALAFLTRVAAQALNGSWSVMLVPGSAGVVTSFGTPGAPHLRWASLPWLPLDRATLLDLEEDWAPSAWADTETSVAAAPLGARGAALLVARVDGPRFRGAEVERLGQLCLTATAATASGSGTAGRLRSA